MQTNKSFNKKYFIKLPIGLIILLAFFAGAVLLFAAILQEVVLEKEEAVDLYIFDFLSAKVLNPNRTIFMKNVTYFASATFLQIAYGILVLLYLIKKDLKRVVEIVAIGLGGFMVNYFMKLWFHRLRPINPLIEPLKNFSFPSGHAMSGFIFYGLLVYLIWKANIPLAVKYISGGVLILFSLLIGFSRIYLRVHYPSDVMAGFCIGFAWLFLSIWLLSLLKKKSL